MTPPIEPSRQSSSVQVGPDQPPAAAEVRTGSPFAVDPVPPHRSAETLDLGAGVTTEMARGGILAGWLLILFAVPCVWGFPFGGVMIAGLGSSLSLFGCAAPRPRWAVAALLIHLTLLTFAVLRWLEMTP